MTAGKNSELCHKLTALQNGFLHIDILIVIMFPLVLALVMYDSYLLKDVHSVLVNFPREYAQESMMLYI